jgi:hypothetical protein
LGVEEVSHGMSWERAWRHMAISEAIFMQKEWGNGKMHGKTSGFTEE